MIMNALIIKDRVCFLKLWALSSNTTSLYKAYLDFLPENIGNLDLDGKKYLVMDENRKFYKFNLVKSNDKASSTKSTYIYDILNDVFKSKIPELFVLQASHCSTGIDPNVQFVVVRAHKSKAKATHSERIQDHTVSGALHL